MIAMRAPSLTRWGSVLILVYPPFRLINFGEISFMSLDTDDLGSLPASIFIVASDGDYAPLI